MRKRKNSTLKISIHTRRFSSKDCLVIGQLAIHGRQLGLELLNFTVQPTDGGKHSVFFGPLVQKQIVASKISDISFQVSNFRLQISFLMLESHALEQRLLVLFNMLTPAKPPVINCQQSATCKIRNHKKTLQKYQQKI
jgi:hypothetical protein